MKERPTFITLHGIDGTGKTTTAARVTTRLSNSGLRVVNYDVYENENTDNPFSLAKKRVLQDASPHAQFAYFLGSTLYHSSQIENLIGDGNHVLKSRYVDDVVAHHSHIGVQDADAIASMFPILQPDFKVILTLEENVRRQRILNRGELDDRDKEVRTAESRLDYFEKYLLDRNDALLRSGNALKLDTTESEPEEIAE